jgi:PilZ domain
MVQSSSQNADRRRRQRFALRCSVEFERNSSVVKGSVQNISSRGFFCVTSEPLAEGEQVRCTIDLTDCAKGMRLLGMNLNCDVTVLRCSPIPEGYGSACVISDYSVARPAVNPHQRAMGAYFQ